MLVSLYEIAMSSTDWSSWLDDLQRAEDLEDSLSGQLRTGKDLSSLGPSIRELQKRVANLSRDWSRLEPQTGAFTV